MSAIGEQACPPLPEPPAMAVATSEWRRQDAASVEAFLELLARAIRQYRTYPAASPLCVDAISACHKALASGDGHDHLTFRVTPHEVLVDDVGMGAGTMVEHELVRRLHRARVSGLSIDHHATLRDVSRFCSDLIGIAEAGETATTFADLLVEHGVDTIVPQMAYQPEVLDLGAPPPVLCDLAAHEKARGEIGASDGPAIHLYPRDKGWVRVDPAFDVGSVSLAELAVLVDNPTEIAEMLLRLTDGTAPGSEPHQTALEQKYSEVATLLTALDPHLGRLMFAKLARAVLDLEPGRRHDLLTRTILPGLLDGQIDGVVLRDFPDGELAEALGLLLDGETAKPDLVWTALDRLELPADRVQAVSPLLDTEIKARAGSMPTGGASGADSGADRHTRDLIRVDAGTGKTFTDFSAFDLSIDDSTREAIARIPDEIASTDLVAVQLQCLSNLVRHEPNPGAVEGFLGRARLLLEELERRSRWKDMVSWLTAQRLLADALRPHRPDVADAVVAALDGFCTRDRAIRMSELYQADGANRAVANAFVEACGASMAPACVALLEDPALLAKARALVPLMCDHAKLLAPDLAARLGHVKKPAARAIVKVLGFAGSGYETAIAEEFGHGDEQTVRESLRALARIGTGRAAALVAAQVQHGSSWVRTAAEEALWHLPMAQAQSQLKELLSLREFVLRNPEIAARLLDRASTAGTDGLGDVLSALASLRFRFWNQALARVGHKARKLVRR